MTTDTPRTDAFFYRTDIGWEDEVEFAQQLERELAVSKAEVKKIKTEYWFMEEVMSKEIATLKEALEELSEAGLREYGN